MPYPQFSICPRIPVCLLLLATLLIVHAAGCTNIEQDPDSGYTYDSAPVAICNPFWGEVPLPNNILNPVAQQQIPVEIAGYTPAVTDHVKLRIYDADMAADAQDLGWPVTADDALNVSLKSGMNALDGFIPDFVNQIPLSKPVDKTTITRYWDADSDAPNTSADIETANFFYLDITDADNPILIDPASYYLIFNLAQAEAYPYYLRMRNAPGENSLLPVTYQAGHTYLVVMTGITANGIKDTDGKPFKPDQYYSLFSSADPFIAADGSSRFNLFDDIDIVQELEEARQTVAYGLDIWEAYMQAAGSGRNRAETVAAWHFTISKRPVAQFVYPPQVKFERVALLPEPANGYIRDCKGNILRQCANASTDIDSLTFTSSHALDAESVSADAVRLMQDMGDGTYQAVDVTAELDAEDATRVHIRPKAALATGDFVVAVSNAMSDADGNPLANASYFDLARATAPLVDDTAWLSPFLDWRVDALIAEALVADYQSAEAEQAQALSLRATNTTYEVLSVLEQTRKRFAAPIDNLLADGFIAARTDLALMWTFSTRDCSDTPDPECAIDVSSLGEENLDGADVSGDFMMKGEVETIIADPIPMDILAFFTMEGDILAGSARVNVELRQPDSPETIWGAQSDWAEVATDGTYSGTVENLLLPASISDLLMADAYSDIALDCKIYNSDGIYCDIVVTLKNAELDGLPVLPEFDLGGWIIAKRVQ